MTAPVVGDLEARGGRRRLDDVGDPVLELLVGDARDEQVRHAPGREQRRRSDGPSGAGVVAGVVAPARMLPRPATKPSTTSNVTREESSPPGRETSATTVGNSTARGGGRSAQWEWRVRPPECSKASTLAPAAVGPEVVERANGPVRRRVAVAAGRADAAAPPGCRAAATASSVAHEDRLVEFVD